jgi:hypothetical protein
MALQQWEVSTSARERLAEMLVLAVLGAIVIFLFALVWLHGPEARVMPMPPSISMPGM